MTTYPYEVPKKLVASVSKENTVRVGAILKSVKTGKIVGHMQPTSAFENVVRTAIGSMGNAATSRFNPFEIVSVVQNQKIIGQLKAIDASLGIIEGMQVANLALSGLGLGVSVAGFAAMSARFTKLDEHLQRIENKIDRFHSEWKEKDLRTLLNEVRVNLDLVASLDGRKNKLYVALTAERELSRLAGLILVTYPKAQFLDRLADSGSQDAAVSQIEHLWSMVSVANLCYDSAFRALFLVDELEAAQANAGVWARSVLELRKGFSADAVARCCAMAGGGASDLEGFKNGRSATLGSSHALVGGMEESIRSLASREQMIQTIRRKRVSGPSYLKKVAKNRLGRGRKEVALLYFPAGKPWP